MPTEHDALRYRFIKEILCRPFDLAMDGTQHFSMNLSRLHRGRTLDDAIDVTMTKTTMTCGHAWSNTITDDSVYTCAVCREDSFE